MPSTSFNLDWARTRSPGGSPRLSILPGFVVDLLPVFRFAVLGVAQRRLGDRDLVRQPDPVAGVTDVGRDAVAVDRGRIVGDVVGLLLRAQAVPPLLDLVWFGGRRRGFGQIRRRATGGRRPGRGSVGGLDGVGEIAVDAVGVGNELPDAVLDVCFDRVLLLLHRDREHGGVRRDGAGLLVDVELRLARFGFDRRQPVFQVGDLGGSLVRGGCDPLALFGVIGQRQLDAAGGVARRIGRRAVPGDERQQVADGVAGGLRPLGPKRRRGEHLLDSGLIPRLDVGQRQRHSNASHPFNAVVVQLAERRRRGVHPFVMVD